MSKTNYCGECGSKLDPNPHRINIVLVTALQKIAAAGGPVHLAKELDLDFSEHCNAQKLQYWGFIENVRRGYWRVTRAGVDFLSGTLAVPERVFTRRTFGKVRVVHRDYTSLVTVHNYDPTVPEIDWYRNNRLDFGGALA